MYSPEQIATWAAQTGYREAILEKVVRLLDVLADVNRHPFLSQVLVLKGGTALNLGFGPPQRLSVDLDFNYVGALEPAAMERDRPRVETALDRLVRAQGYQPQRSRAAHAGRTYFLAYRNLRGAPDRIEVDLNFMYRQPLLPTLQRTLWSPDPTGAVPTRIVSIEELCAGKICALLDRMTPRDLFDVRLLPSLMPAIWTSATLRTIVIALSGTLPHPLHTYHPARMQRLSADQIERQLHPMLIQGQEPSTELLTAAWHPIAPFLQLSPEETEYVDRLQRGELRPEVLCPDDPALASRIRQHPALQWKAKNAAKHRP